MSEYSEDRLIEQTCIDLFQNQLGWETANVYQGESFGSDSTLGRDSEADVILKTRFFAAIQSLNPDLPQQAYNSAFETINADYAAKPIAEINFEKYQFIKDGIPVTFKNDKGEIIRNKKIKVFDFDTPENNHFLAVQQLWVEGKSKRKKRPDIVGFVNGLPLLFIELKAHHRKLKVAYEDNLKDYKATIPKLFHCNAFIILSNGLESKIGAVTSRYEHFNDWKRIEENEEGRVSLETILLGVCERNRFIDLLENFIMFDDSVGSVIKLIARNHQFLGVNKAINHIKLQNDKYEKGEITLAEKQKLGVFWHTQGSGKSYSMVFLCQKILRKVGGYTFLLVTDRLELDKQIYGTFSGVGAVKDKSARADSGEDLQKLLKTDTRYIFTLIHKFNFEYVVTGRDNIIVISDEAHRTQGGSLAVNMRKVLPKASFMGFTGTPLFKDDELTRRIFGDYVSTYDFKRSIEDGATVPLYYENRGEKLRLDNPKINQEIRDAIEAAETDSDQEEKLKRLFARDYPILTAQKRLRAIAKDVVKHFNGRGYKGKAMYVAIDKVTAVKMYDLITEEWKKFIEEQGKEVEKITDLQEQLIRRKEWQWAKETEVAVVVSHEQNEIDKFEAWGLDIEHHRKMMNTRDLEKEFKDENNPFRFVIVCAMWITGFDVPSLSTMYIDKPLKSHTLMQTIARANRIHEGKNNGLIVDYIETYKSLLEALAIYAIGGDKVAGAGAGGATEPPVKPLDELVADLREAINATIAFLNDEVSFDISTIIVSEGFDKLAAIAAGVEAVKTNDETRNKFGVLAREVFQKYKALMPDQAIHDFKDERDAINAIYATITDDRDEADVTSIVKQVQDVVDRSIENLNMALEPVEGYGSTVDISGLDFKKIEEEFLKIPNKNTAVQSLKDRVEKKLNRMLDQNPLRVDYYERYQKIIDEYNIGKEYKTIKEIFDQLLGLFQDLSEEDKRAVREDVTEDELTVLDMLEKGKKISNQEKATLKETAKQLLGRLLSQEFKVEHWPDKVSTASAVKSTIDDVLFEKLPYPTYAEQDISEKTDLLFNYFKIRYADYGSQSAA
ncbi:MAG: type I restriction endonuclease subunit R [Bacteroidetes bacterium]|nr:type I restriction endonuclease subunit R [Bacteroidota bacterium]